MKINNDLRKEVIKLHNELFNLQIEKDERFVSDLCMMTICTFYSKGSGSPFAMACYADECMEKIEDENTKLEICKRLLSGEKVTIPGMRGEFCLWYIFYDVRTGKKFNK